MMNTLTGSLLSSVLFIRIRIPHSLIQYVQMKMDLSDLLLPTTANEDNSYLADCLYAFASYIISRSNLIKTKKNMADISMDVNKVVLSKE